MDNILPCNQPEIWAGPECSIIRVQDVYRDQLEETGHYGRPEDIDLIADLNISRVRYPILWERHQPALNTNINWSFIAGRLKEFRARNIEVIAGLLHHGSGPSFTSLGDANFPHLFAQYAGMVATQFPHIKYYTPINEPLTTARFSGLYGFWYPHQRSEPAFFRLFLNQLKAIVLAMKEIRKINPDAELIQTEDLAQIESTKELSYQANFENRRKWLTMDFLCGKVMPGHFFWNYLLKLGIPAKDLNFFIDNTCPPGLIGHNYYVTSERFLDGNVEKYSNCLHGGNGRHNYVDTELVRAGKMKGLYKLLCESWNRYHLPIALTECHLNCTREEQLRWIYYCLQVGRKLRSKGIPFQAVTIWSVFGSMDWDSLVTQRNYKYESGVFDMTDGKPRPTALASLIKKQSRWPHYIHPLLLVKGWWEDRDDSKSLTKKIRPVIILGEKSLIAKTIITTCISRGIPFLSFSEIYLKNIQDDVLQKKLLDVNPWAFVYVMNGSTTDDINGRQFACNTVEFDLYKIAQLCHIGGSNQLLILKDNLEDEREKILSIKNTIDILNLVEDAVFPANNNLKKTDPLVVLIRPEIEGHLTLPSVKIKSSKEKNLKNHAASKSSYYLQSVIDKAMDLFIDGESGVWDLGIEQAIRPGEQNAANTNNKGNNNENKIIATKRLGLMKYSRYNSNREINLKTLKKSKAFID